MQRSKTKFICDHFSIGGTDAENFSEHRGLMKVANSQQKIFNVTNSESILQSVWVFRF